jgi:hypothetical protein
MTATSAAFAELPGHYLEALLFEIAAALANGEVGDDQDHG